MEGTEGTEGAQSPEGTQAGGPGGRRKKRRALLAVIGAALLILLAEPAAVAGAALTAVGGGLYLTDPVRAVPQVTHTETTQSLRYREPLSCGDASMGGYWTPPQPGAAECPRNYAVWPAQRNMAHLFSFEESANVQTGQPLYVALTGTSYPGGAGPGGLTLTAAGASAAPVSALVVATTPSSGQGVYRVTAEAPRAGGVAPPTTPGAVVQETEAWVLRYAHPGTYRIDIGLPGDAAWRSVPVTVAAAPAGATFTATAAATVPVGLAWWLGNASVVGGSGLPAEGGRFAFSVHYPAGVPLMGTWTIPGRDPRLATRTLPAGPAARWSVTSSVSGTWPVAPAWMHAAQPFGPSATGYPLLLTGAVSERMPATATTYRTEPLLLSWSKPGSIGWDPYHQFEWPNLLAMATGLLLLLLAVRRLRRRVASQARNQ